MESEIEYYEDEEVEDAVNTEQPFDELVELKMGSDRRYTASTKFWTLRIIYGSWLNKLTPPEFMVVMFIWQRTMFWGKFREFIKYRHFLKGIPDVIAPLPFKERRLQQILKDLEKRNVLIREHRIYGSFYSLDYKWNPRKKRRKKPNKNNVVDIGERLPCTKVRNR